MTKQYNKRHIKVWRCLVIFYTLIVFICSCTSNSTNSYPHEITHTTSNELKNDTNSIIQKWSGEYNSTLNNDGNFVGTISIDYAGEKQANFMITTGEAAGCTGELSGKMLFVQDYKAHYSGNGCTSLDFQFGGDSLIITEKDCAETHGQNCPYAGKFNKFYPERQ